MRLWLVFLVQPVAASSRSLIIVLPDPGNPANPVLVTKTFNVTMFISLRESPGTFWSCMSGQNAITVQTWRCIGVNLAQLDNTCVKQNGGKADLSLYESFFGDHSVGESRAEPRMNLMKVFEAKIPSSSSYKWLSVQLATLLQQLPLSVASQYPHQELHLRHNLGKYYCKNVELKTLTSHFHKQSLSCPI